MQEFENSVTEVKLEHITFLVTSHFKPDGIQSIDQKLCNIMLQDSQKMITKPIS